MPAKKLIADTSKASYTMDNNRLPRLGVTGSGEGEAPGSIDAGPYWAGLAAGAGAVAVGATSGDAGDGAGTASAGDLGAPAGCLRGALPSLRRSCSGKRLYSSHFCFRSCFFA